MLISRLWETGFDLWGKVNKIIYDKTDGRISFSLRQTPKQYASISDLIDSNQPPWALWCKKTNGIYSIWNEIRYFISISDCISSWLPLLDPASSPFCHFWFHYQLTLGRMFLSDIIWMFSFSCWTLPCFSCASIFAANTLFQTPPVLFLLLSLFE